MRTVSKAALVFAALFISLPARPVQSQLKGLIKKKAVDAAKGTGKSADASTAPTDPCGPVTPQKIQDFLRGLQAEASAQREFDATRIQAESSSVRAKACRDAGTGGPDYTKMMLEGFSGPNPPSTPAAVQQQMAQNKAKWEEYLDKKCGKPPLQQSYDERGAYAKAHAAGAKEAGMSEACYDATADRVLAFCKLSNKEQAAAAEKGIRVQRFGEWVFTLDEAKALQSRCSDLMAALKNAGHTLAQ
jgi:hypothetical protein